MAAAVALVEPMRTFLSFAQAPSVVSKNFKDCTSRIASGSSALNDLDLHLQRHEAIEAENRVVEIAFGCAIFEAPVVVLLALKKIANQSGGFTEELRRQPRDLQHFEPHAHRAIKLLR